MLPPAVYETTCFITLTPTFNIFKLNKVRQSGGWKWYLVILIYICLTVNQFHMFCMFIGHLYFPFRKFPICILCQFLLWIVYAFCFLFIGVICILFIVIFWLLFML